MALPRIAPITPGATTTRIACAIDAIVVTTDMEKIKNKR